MQLKKVAIKEAVIESKKIDSNEDIARNFDAGLEATGFEDTDQKWVEKPPGYFSGHEVGDEDFKELKDKDVNSVELNIGKSFASGVGFKYLVGKPITLVFTKSEEFNDEGAHELAKIKSLRRLKIHFSNKLTNKGLKELMTLPNLFSLQLRFNHRLPPDVVKTISESKVLSKVDLGHSKPITIDDFANVTKMKSVDTICLTNTDFGDELIPVFAKVANLRVLEIKGVKLSEKGLISLAHLKNLRTLKVSLEGEITSLAVKKLQIEREKAGLKELQLILGSHFEG